MQIHELNNFIGALDSSAFAVLDNGNDTGKIAVPALLESVTNGINALNARLDNIITSPAPTEEEIIDARIGADGVTYPSLGDAIRDQIDGIESNYNITLLNGYDKDSLEPTRGYWSNNDGNFVADNNYFACNKYARVKPGTKYSLWYGAGIAGVYCYVIFYDFNKTFISGSVMPQNIITSPSNAVYVRVCVQADSGKTGYVFCEGETYLGLNPFGYSLEKGRDIAFPQLDAVTEEFTEFSYTSDEEVGYMNQNGEILAAQTSFHCLTTNDIDCKQGDQFLYYGSGKWGAYSYVTFLDGAVVSNGQIDGTGIITIPSGVNAIRISSFATTENDIILKVFRISPLTAQEQLKQLAQLSSLLNVKIDIIGDSWSAVNNTASVKYTDLLVDKDHADVKVLAASGRGFFNGTSANSLRFYEQANNVRADADIVFIFGSFNDVSKIIEGSTTIGNVTDSGTSTICGCINQTIDNIIAINPGAKILFATPGAWGGYNANNDGNNVNNPTALAYVEAIKNVCYQRGYECRDFLRMLNLKPWINAFATAYMPDNTHPNNAGHEKFIYPVVHNYLLSVM